MRVLVVGGGGREHALAWALARSASVREVWSAPGNPGCAALGPCRPVPAHDLDALVELATAERFELVVVGPEIPLVLGVADRLRQRGVTCFGPSAAAARLEGSKAFAKTVMARAGVPSAPFAVAESVDETLAAVRRLGLPIVLKADGLAAGKGVKVCYTLEQARAFAWEAQAEGRFGDSGRRLVVEGFLVGEEVSLFALAAGDRAQPLIAARDYKRVGTGDVGPNTGGMGAFAPADLDAAAAADLVTGVVEPVLGVLAREGAPYAGLLYCGLMLTASGPAVLEFNCRFGDPETQAILPLLASDAGELLLACAQGRLPAAPIWEEGACVAVVLAAAGYPDSPRAGDPVLGVEGAAALPDVQVFHGGTRLEGGRLVSAAGRVLTVSARGATRAAARATAYEALAHIGLDGGQWRDDVGAAPARAKAEESLWP